MPGLPPSSKYLQRPDAPIDDVERESITKRLSDAFTDGRLAHDDYMVALDEAYNARTLGELVPVVEKLPAAAVDVPAIVRPGTVPAGQTNESRNVMLPAVAAAGAAIGLIAIIAILLIILL